MDQYEVNNAIAQAAALINSDRFNALVEQKAGSTKKGKNGKRGGGNEFAAYEAMAFGSPSTSSSSKQYLNENTMTQTSQPQKRKSGIPEEIQESFRQMPAMSGGMSMMTPPASYYQPTQQRGMVTEQYAPQSQPQPQYQPVGGSVDYNYIKYIINECIKENLSSQLNESANLSGLKMMGGNKIRFIDSKGAVYEGVLKRVK